LSFDPRLPHWVGLLLSFRQINPSSKGLSRGLPLPPCTVSPTFSRSFPSRLPPVKLNIRNPPLSLMKPLAHFIPRRPRDRPRAPFLRSPPPTPWTTPLKVKVPISPFFKPFPKSFNLTPPSPLPSRVSLILSAYFPFSLIFPVLRDLSNPHFIFFSTLGPLFLVSPGFFPLPPHCKHVFPRQCL